jgi:hypothetical protein
MTEVHTYQSYHINKRGGVEFKTSSYTPTGIPRGFKARGTQEDKDRALELLAQGMMQKDVVKETGLSTYMVRKLKLLMSK